MTTTGLVQGLVELKSSMTTCKDSTANKRFFSLLLLLLFSQIRDSQCALCSSKSQTSQTFPTLLASGAVVPRLSVRDKGKTGR